MASCSVIDNIPLKDLCLFHSPERYLYMRMVFQVGVNPNLSMEIIAFWMWLEEIGHPNITCKIGEFSDDAIRVIAFDSIKCIAGFSDLTDPSSIANDSPATTFSIEDSPINVAFVNNKRSQALEGISSTLNNVCVKIFTDLLDLSLAIKNTESLPNPPHQNPGDDQSHSGEGSNNDGSKIGRNSNHFVNITATTDSDFVQTLLDRENSGGMNEGYYLNYKHEELNPLAVYKSWTPTMQMEVPQDERTLFLTFSNGHPLKEEDLRQFFSRNFGEIEEVFLQQVVSGEEPIFARTVFKHPQSILHVLKGKEKMKFVINGKHVWARRYIPKKKRNFM
ncbi:hypothetical protein ZOSMA_166G00660 [Zostera marina]|uniref:RRM domain-containing protein n=1 Tax=Zostera marina TaxID=29655 RepID=A0A0K9PTQ9_ZOSMR|nr:hypothetical protein ZOSMA_166G00660 [Zostera marina]